MPDNILLLQGPVGPFFKYFALELEQHGHQVHKINFNGGDQFFYRRKNSYRYTGEASGWQRYLENFLKMYDIDRVYVFGDCRSYHKIAQQQCKHLDIRYYVFEEGYLRPNYITLEENGVNGHSNINFSYSETLTPLRVIKSKPTRYNHVFVRTALYASLYYVASSLMRWNYPYYQHHRPLNSFHEGRKWLFSYIKRLTTHRRDRKLAQYLIQQKKKRYFLVPLQVHSDMQIKQHSRFNDVVEFIDETLTSFAAHASDKDLLVIKHHPLDRAYRNYHKLITATADELGIGDRVYYLYDCHLPTLIRYSKGTVTINSTVGLSSLFHSIPVKAMGDAVYNVSKLTFQGSLDDFWKSGATVDMKAYKTFRNFLLDSNQLNGNFYCRAYRQENHSGLVWSPFLGQTHLGNPALSTNKSRAVHYNEKAA